jgi:hypothetical protein
MRVCREEERCR